MRFLRCAVPVVLGFWFVSAVDLASGGGAAAPRRGVWFCGDFEAGGLQGWSGDLARSDSAVVVTQPVRKGRYAVRITLAPGDRAADKERAELKIGDKSIERLHGSQGGEMWYGWSLFLPAGYIDPPEDQFQIVSQWHQQLPATAGRGLKGAPPVALHLVANDRGHALILIGQSTPTGQPRTLAEGQIRQGAWTDLIVHIRWSTGKDGFVEAWLDGRPFTQGKKHGPTLYSPVSNYWRLGLYRHKGGSTTNTVYYDEVRVGDSYEAVAP
jgi:Polysaccharide lyase